MNVVSKWKRFATFFTNGKNYIVKHGWEQGWGEAEGATCIMGGLHMGNGSMEPSEWTPIVGGAVIYTAEEYQEARKILLDVINSRSRMPEPWQDPINYNDHGPRKKSEVLLQLDRAIAYAEERAAHEAALQMEAEKVIARSSSAIESGRTRTKTPHVRKQIVMPPKRRVKQTA